MIDESHRTRLASALQQQSPELPLAHLVRDLKAEGMPVSELIDLYHESLLRHTDDADATRHDAIHKVLLGIRGVADVDSYFPPPRIPRKKPYFGLMAVSAPFLAIAVACVVGYRLYALYGDKGGLGAFVYILFSALLVLSLGVIASILALLRREKYTALGWVGIVVNLGPVLLFLLPFFIHR